MKMWLACAKERKQLNVCAWETMVQKYLCSFINSKWHMFSYCPGCHVSSFSCRCNQASGAWPHLTMTTNMCFIGLYLLVKQVKHSLHPLVLSTSYIY